jgi:hypothetical protein
MRLRVSLGGQMKNTKVRLFVSFVIFVVGLEPVAESDRDHGNDLQH